MADKYFSILNVEAGKTAAGLTVKQDGTAQYDAVNVFGRLNGAIVEANAYIGVGNGGVTDTVAVAAAQFDVWNGGTARNTDLWAGANMFVMDGAVARDTDVNANGALHITGKAYDTDVLGGFVGVGANGVADDIRIFGGNVDVFNGGTVVDANVRAGVMTLWSGATAVDTEINGGEVRLAGGAYMIGEVEVNNGDLVFFASDSRFGEGEITVSTGGAITTWGDNCFCGPIIFDMAGADVLDKVRVDNIGAIGDSCIEVEIDSGLDAGRYLMAGNAEFLKGCNILVRDDYNSESIIQIGECGFYANNRTYCFNVDANNNLYMDVIDGMVQVDCSNQSTNSLGTGSFGAAGEQIVWINEDKSAIGIVNVGTYAAAGEFVGIGDFDGNRIDDILFANGNDLICTFFFDDNADTVVDRTYTHTYTDLLSYGTMDDFQVGNVDGFGDPTEEVFLKADNEYFAFNLIDNTKDASTDITAYSAVIVPNKFACVK